MAQLVNPIQQKFLDANGDPLAGGKIYSYEAGTSTPKATFTDQSGAVANDNPIILDANGDATIWIDTGFYKFVIHDAEDNLVRTIDNVSIFGEGTVTTDTLADGSVTTAKIADNAVNTAKILNNAVTTDKINADAVTTAKIADSNVTTAKINDLAVTTGKLADGAVTGPKKAPLGQQVSSTNIGGTTSTTFVDLANATLTITTTGRPVFIGLRNFSSSLNGYVQIANPSGSTLTFVRIYRDATNIATHALSFGTNGNGYYPLGSFWYLDTPSAGTYTYKLQAQTATDCTLTMNNAQFIAFEL